MRIDVRVDRGPRDEDRVGVWIGGTRASIVVADGAGNSGRGRAAADLAAALAAKQEPAATRLSRLDGALAQMGAEAAVVIVDVESHSEGLSIVGAAAGDVRAWALDAEAWRELTLGVPRKPLVGSGATPIEIRAHGARAILIATDGLRGWGGPDSRAHPFSPLVDAVRLPSGALSDDVAIARIDWRDER